MYVSETPLIIGNAREEFAVLAEMADGRYDFRNQKKLGAFSMLLADQPDPSIGHMQRRQVAEAMNSIHTKIRTALPLARLHASTVYKSTLERNQTHVEETRHWHTDYIGNHTSFVIGSDVLDLVTTSAVGCIEDESAIVDLTIPRQDYIVEQLKLKNLTIWRPGAGDLALMSPTTLHQATLHDSDEAVVRVLHHTRLISAYPQHVWPAHLGNQAA